MEVNKVAVIGLYAPTKALSQGSKEDIKNYLSNKTNIHCRILFTLKDYLTKYSKKFDRVRFRITDQGNHRFPNGSWSGIMGSINRSEIDIGVRPVTMNEERKDIVDFSYPYTLSSTTFLTRKAEYKPQIFGIFQTFSLPLWITIISTLMAMALIYYFTLRKRYSFDTILLHSFAVLLRQSAILKPASMIDNLLVFSWVAGAMFFCLAYDSVFLSFLAFPPINQIKDVPLLAKAVKEGHYHCIASPQSAIFQLLLKSNENLRIIGRDLNMNNLSNNENIFQDFFYDRSEQDLALLVDTEIVDLLTVGNKFVSEDRFLENMAAMTVRKDFYCKTLVEKFIHTFMASGLYFKYQSDRAFLIRMPRLLNFEDKDIGKRKLSLIDVAPAFIFLIFGHTISFLVLIVEIFSNRMKKPDLLKKNKIRMKIIYKEDST